MGLVDHIDIHSTLLPKGVDHIASTWQTKSLGCDEDKYLIDENGYLWHDCIDTNPDLCGWDKTTYTGEIRMINNNYQILAWCVNGHVKEIVQV